MKPLASVPWTLPPQGVRVIMDLAWQDPECIHLEVGEPNFPTPDHIVEAAVEAARTGFHKYTPNAGIAELREAIAQKMRRYNGLDVTAEQVCVHPGAVTGIFTTVMALVDPGDEVLLPALSWPNAEMSVRLLGGTPVPYPLRAEDGFLPDFDRLEQLITPRTKAILVNSPGNPTGAVFDETTVRRIADFCRRHDLWLISDEIYEHIVFDHAHVSPARFAPERTITVSGLSKAYAMTGWRIGYTVSPPEVASVIIKLQEPVISSTNSIAQKAAVAALTGPQDCVEAMRNAYRQRRDLAMDVLRRHGLARYTPQGAFYLLVDVSAYSMDSFEAAKAILRETHVAVAPGEAFGAGGAGFVRVSLANREDLLEEGLERICRFVEAHAVQRQTG